MKDFPIILSVGLFIAWIASWVAFYFYRRKKKTNHKSEYISFKEAIDKFGETTKWFDQVNWYNSSSWDWHTKEPTPFEYNREHLLRFVYNRKLSLYRDPSPFLKENLPCNRKFCAWDEEANIITEPKFRHSPQALFVKVDELNHILENPDIWVEEPKYTQQAYFGGSSTEVNSEGFVDKSQELNNG